MSGHRPFSELTKDFTPARRARVAARAAALREAMTLESIERDPWKAVDLPLPKDVDRSLLAAVALVADQCAKAGFAVARVAEIVEPEVAWRYRVREVEAGERRDEARRELGALPVEQVAKVSPFLHPDEMQHKAVVRLLNIEADRQRLPGNLPSPYGSMDRVTALCDASDADGPQPSDTPVAASFGVPMTSQRRPRNP